MALLAELLTTPYLVQALCAAVLVLFVSSFWQDLADEIPYGRVPLVGKKWWDLSNKKAKARFAEAARALIAEGFAKVRTSLGSPLTDVQYSMLTSMDREQVSSRSWLQRDPSSSCIPSTSTRSRVIPTWTLSLPRKR
jgi:hypothetical protein